MKKFFLGFLFFLLFPIMLFSGQKGKISKPKVYDCFMFFNELDLLEIRFNELYPYVDKFVIVESCETHKNADPKPFYFDLSKDRFSRFADKIIYVKLEEHFEANDPWEREHWQRNQITRGLKDCKPNDIIIISDVDEIIPGEIVPLLDKKLKETQSIYCWQKMFRYFLNRSCQHTEWAGTGIVRFKDMQSPQWVRDMARNGKLGYGWHAGWHFTSMGGFKSAELKCHIIADGSGVFVDEETWREGINNAYPLMPIDESYPKFVRENIPYLIERNLIDVVTIDNFQK